MKLITSFFIISLVICSNELAAMGTGADGPLLVEQDMPLIGDDNEFDFLSIFISSGATLSAEPSSYPSGISIFSLGDIYIDGLIDFSGVDLTILTPGKFEVGPTGGFLARNFSIMADEVTISGNFQVVPGGTLDIVSNPSGDTASGVSGQAQISLTGMGFTLTQTNIGTLSNTVLFPPVSADSTLIVLPVSLVPLPPAIGLVMLPLVVLRAIKREANA